MATSTAAALPVLVACDAPPEELDAADLPVEDALEATAEEEAPDPPEPPFSRADTFFMPHSTDRHLV